MPMNRLRAKRHRCTLPGCGKTFTRPSHLQRHALNHSENQWVCSRCQVPFKRLDLLERHKARHTVKDSLAGGAGLGILQTRRKHIAGEHTGLDSLLALPDPPSELDVDSLNAADTSSRDGIPTAVQPIQPPPGPVNTFSSPPENPCELGNMYYDTTFDSVHFDVMGFACSPTATTGQFPSTPEGMPQYPPEKSLRESLPFYNSPRSIDWSGMRSSYRASMMVDVAESPSAAGLQRRMNVAALVNDSTILPQPPTESGDRRLETPIQDVVHQTSDTTTTYRPGGEIQLPSAKREEILALLKDIQPVTPEGALVDGTTELLSLRGMQEFLDLFFRYFNSSYPMVHVATLQIGSADAIFVLSMLILGATYKNKDAHQLSVCLYDAVVPYILSGLMSIPTPDLSTLQAFLILECYGMYRAGPYQRENAMLIHTLLFSAIRRVSRYHVLGGITLPNHLIPHDGSSWKEFAYAEQYKRLILFVFMWDTQNVSCYSFMPHMSTQNIQVPLPCAPEIWAAKTESAWTQARLQHPHSPPNFNDTVKSFITDGDKLHSSSLPLVLSPLALQLILHGIMSMCNDIAHFDNRAIYLGDHPLGESESGSWRRRMTHVLETWKATYDASAMAALQQQKKFQDCEERTALLALYHTAHIVINAEIRHLQAAAGAKAIFGHLVTAADRQLSANWVEQWVRGPQGAQADHAAWHAAQMFREGLLGLKNWDVQGVFHYPWCLVLGALTCWAFHRYGGDPGSCGHSRGEEMESATVMNHMVSLMASVSPTEIRRTQSRCCTHGLMAEVARYLKSVRWTAAFEAMKLLEGLAVS
ncbi:hypothetical protein FE257_005540 [Aspergillus nanangensis]|uniref:C2H2-type domain-containing protein n=1 Tax=Aspergillus nanangensis TaxID=2582783 RepID=A0AAD4CQ52_ASPNN|nr:hypothetical protein FE257_005540 [Aspergillus nanangensis]